MNISPSKIEKAAEAIDYLSSLVGQVGSTSQEEAEEVPTRKSQGGSRSCPIVLHENNSGFPEENTGRLGEATEKALTTLNKLRDGSSGRKRSQSYNRGPLGSSSNNKRVKQEINGIFRPKNKGGSLKCKTWRHKFCCLASYDQERSPTTDSEKDMLQRAGLGNKEIAIDLSLNQEQFHDLIIQHYPRLKDAGGFRFLKGTSCSRNLEQLSLFVHKSPRNLKERVGSSRTYIRPLQKNLDLTPEDEDDEAPIEKCLNCGEVFALDVLEDHLGMCNKNRNSGNDCEIDQTLLENISSTSSDDDEELPPPLSLYKKDNYGEKSLESENGDDTNVEESLFQFAVRQSLGNDANLNKGDIEDLITPEVDSIAKAIKATCTPTLIHSCYIEVRRSFLLTDALKEARKTKFNPLHLIKVSFIGEWAVDVGGPRREFFRLLALQARDMLFTGTDTRKFFMTDVDRLKDNDYYNFGCYMGMSVTQGGCGCPFLHNEVYNYMATNKTTNITVSLEDIPNSTLRYVCEKIDNCDNDEELKQLFAIDEASALLLETGYRRPLTNLKASDGSSIKSLLIDYHCMIKMKAAMDEFIRGLTELKVAQLVKQYPTLAKPLFVDSNEELTAERLKEILNVQFSVVGSNCRRMEEQAWVNFIDFLDDCEEGKTDCKVQDILIFMSGCSSVPPIGFSSTPKVTFIHNDGRLCTASTCDLIIRLPTVHEVYSDFKEAITLSLIGNDGLGGGV